MKHEPRPGDGSPVPRQPSSDSDARKAVHPSEAPRPLKTPEVHHVLPIREAQKASDRAPRANG